MAILKTENLKKYYGKDTTCLLYTSGEVNIEYMYAFANGSDAAAVLKSDDPARVIDILKGSGFDVYSADEAYRANM